MALYQIVARKRMRERHLPEKLSARVEPRAKHKDWRGVSDVTGWGGARVPGFGVHSGTRDQMASELSLNVCAPENPFSDSV
jgi:hypothetical protein